MILVDDKHAVMTQSDFIDLSNYSCSIPSGVVIGKRWRRALVYLNQTDNAADWVMGEYVPDGPDHARIQWREILIVEG